VTSARSGEGNPSPVKRPSVRPSQTLTPTPTTSQGGATPGTASSTQTTTEDLPDPVLRIFVHSSIPDTVPLIVKRRLSQRTQEVREAWVARQSLPPDVRPESIYLTFRNTKIYNSTTLSTLGLRGDRRGRVFLSKGKYGQEEYVGEDLSQSDDPDSAPGITLEAVTPEIHKENQRKKRAALEEEEDDGDHADAGPEAETSAPEPVAAQGPKIILRAPKHDDVKLSVKPVCLTSPPSQIFECRSLILTIIPGYHVREDRRRLPQAAECVF
jgi:hypothetical protein